MMSTEQNEAMDRRVATEVLNGHNLDAISEPIAEDFIEQNPPLCQRPGREGLRRFLAEMIEAFFDMRWGAEEAVAEGDRTASWGTEKGTHRGTSHGHPTDRTHRLRGVLGDESLPQRQDGGKSHHHGHDGADAAAWSDVRSCGGDGHARLTGALG
jgi:predicted ester cyclase